ncbi:MAG: ribonuclease PH, partial [Vampirovibrionales bacterium]
MYQRQDDRRYQQLRPIEVTRGYTQYAPGSILLKMGNTHVLATATIENRVPRHLMGPNNEVKSGWVTAEYALLPSATHTRNARERQKLSGRTAEIQRLIGRSLRACIDLEQLGQHTITIDADVIQADGGTRCASITAGFLALHDAVGYLLKEKALKRSPILYPIAALSVG